MKNIRIQWFVLFIMVLLLMGCGVQKNVDFKSDQGMKIANALPIREDIRLDRSNLDMLDEILVQCLTDYDINKSENEDWMIYECEPIEDTFYADCPVIEVKKNFTSEILTYEEAKPFSGTSSTMTKCGIMWKIITNMGLGRYLKQLRVTKLIICCFWRMIPSWFM